MAEVAQDEFLIPPLAPERSLDLRAYYNGYSDTLIVSFYGQPEAGMNVPIGDEHIDLRVTLDESTLIGLEVPGFAETFLKRFPEYLDFAASAGVPCEVIEGIRAQISTTERQRSAVESLLRQFASVSLDQ